MEEKRWRGRPEKEGGEDTRGVSEKFITPRKKEKELLTVKIRGMRGW